MNHRTAIYCIVLILLNTILFAQNRRDRTPGQLHSTGEIAIQTLNIVSQSATKSRLDVGYRIPRSFFVFTRDNAPSAKYGFSASGEIIIEILDSAKTSAGHDVIHKELFADEEQDDSLFVTGAVSFDLAPGMYSLVVEIDDHNSNRKFRDPSRSITLKDFSQGTFEISDVVFCDPAAPADGELQPYTMGGNIPFNRNALCYAQISAAPVTEPVKVAYRLLQILPDELSPRIVMNDTLGGIVVPGRHLRLGGEENSFRYIITDALLPGVLACSFELRTDTLPVGAYQLEVDMLTGARSVSAKKKFQILWQGMPLSLRQLKFAVESMEYLFTGDGFKELRSANPGKQRKLFDEYWKQRDPTPHTALNEMMQEYFRRVDYAFANFNTLQEPNGVKTERGKAYILYGPPTSVNRNLLPSSDPQEIWLYANLQKKLTFVDEHHNGNYKLIAAENL